MRKISVIILLLSVLSACVSYKQVSLDKHTFYNNTKVPDKIDRYNVYVHDGKSLYRLDDQTFYDDTLRGSLTTVSSGTVNAHPESKRALRESRRDMHVYLSKSAAALSSQVRDSSSARPVTIDRNAVDRVDMFTVNEKHIFMQIGSALLLLGLSVLLVFGMIYAIAKGSEEATNNSGSGSNSNSDSGDSGGSNSGGSDSGCYVATMVYGSYDAPNVLVLRRFRDRFLLRFSAGRAFVCWYYRNSPGFVDRHRSKMLLHRMIRFGLNGFVWLLRPFFGH